MNKQVVVTVASRGSAVRVTLLWP